MQKRLPCYVVSFAADVDDSTASGWSFLSARTRAARTAMSCSAPSWRDSPSVRDYELLNDYKPKQSFANRCRLPELCSEPRIPGGRILLAGRYWCRPWLSGYRQRQSASVIIRGQLLRIIVPEDFRRWWGLPVESKVEGRSLFDSCFGPNGTALALENAMNGRQANSRSREFSPVMQAVKRQK